MNWYKVNDQEVFMVQFPISFYITKYDLTPDRYEESLNDSLDLINGQGYGTYHRKHEWLTFKDSYDDWVIQEIYLIEEANIYNCYSGNLFRVAHKGD